ncbi:MAG: tRNA-binding protein [Thermoleophilaceae bacterium]
MATFEEFLRIDMRVGRVVRVEDFPEARNPAWKLWIDFGPEMGERGSSAQITHYTREELEGSLVVAVVNFPPRRIASFDSEVLVLGALDDEQGVVLLRPDRPCVPGDRIG